jgi:hypothetical protein
MLGLCLGLNPKHGPGPIKPKNITRLTKIKKPNQAI